MKESKQRHICELLARLESLYYAEQDRGELLLEALVELVIELATEGK